MARPLGRTNDIECKFHEVFYTMYLYVNYIEYLILEDSRVVSTTDSFMNIM